MSTEDTTVRRSGAAWRLEVDEVYLTDPADLWSACTEPERLARWMAEYRGDLRLGGRWEALSDGQVWGSGEVVECDPPRAFTTTWTAEGERSTVLTVRLEPVAGGTRLRLEHDGVADRQYLAGWAAYRSMLSDHVADPSREDLGEAGFGARYAALRPRFEPVAAAAGLP